MQLWRNYKGITVYHQNYSSGLYLTYTAPTIVVSLCACVCVYSGGGGGVMKPYLTSITTLARPSSNLSTTILQSLQIEAQLLLVLGMLRIFHSAES